MARTEPAGEKAEKAPPKAEPEDSYYKRLGVTKAATAAEIEDGLKIVPSPGHTPGTIRIEFESKGEKAVFCGDILHHAVQIYNPDWNSFACLDAANARKSRRATIEACAGSGALLMPCHFGAPFHCHIDHKGAGFAPRFAGNF